MCVCVCVCMGGGGAQQLQCKSESARSSENNRALVRRMGGGLKFEKNKCWKNNKVHTLEKIGHRFPCILYFFIHTQPNNKGPARQQPRDWPLFL